MSTLHRVLVILSLLVAGCQLDEPVPPLAKFTYVLEDENCTGPCVVSFTDASENTSVYSWTYHWDFGGQETSTDRNPKHLYKTAGDHIVTFTISGKYGSATFIDTISIKKVEIEARFTVVDTGRVDSAVVFKNESKNAETFLWDFGDGSANSTSIEENPKHIYKKEGKFIVTLTAKGKGGSATYKDSIVIVGPQLSADFAFQADTANADSTKVSFTDKSTNAVKFKWDFGNGKTSTERDPVVWYIRKDADKKYTVKLTVEDTKKVVAAKVDTVIINQKK